MSERRWEYNGYGEIFLEGVKVAIAGASIGSPRIKDLEGNYQDCAKWITEACNEREKMRYRDEPSKN